STSALAPSCREVTPGSRSGLTSMIDFSLSPAALIDAMIRLSARTCGAGGAGGSGVAHAASSNASTAGASGKCFSEDMIINLVQVQWRPGRVDPDRRRTDFRHVARSSLPCWRAAYRQPPQIALHPGTKDRCACLLA